MMISWETVKFSWAAMSLDRAAAKPKRDIEKIQRRRLNELVAYAKQHSIFYGKKFAHIDETKFELAELPTSNKSEMMQSFEETLTVRDVSRADVVNFIGDAANRGQYFREKYVLGHTSGSQGQPMLLVQPKENIELLFELQASRGNRRSVGVREAVGRLLSPARLAAVTVSPGFYPSATAFQHMPDGARSFMTLMWAAVNDVDLVSRLDEFRPTHLTAYASALTEIAREIEAGNLSLQPELEQVINISERLLPHTRQQLEEIFGAPIIDDYGVGECLFLSNGCPTSNGMHVNADWAILEVVDENNRPVPVGESGAKVLITNLANNVQPIIRYEIGDLVTMATKPCGCGSNMPLIERIDGRDSEMFYVDTTEGQRSVSPLMFEFAVSQILDAREYQIIHEDSNRFRILIEPLQEITFDREHADDVLRTHLINCGFGDVLQVELEVVDRLNSNGNTKFKRVISNVRQLAELN